MSRRGKMKANRKTFQGVLRIFIDKYEIPDGEWFDRADLSRFWNEEKEIYLKEKGIETIDDYRKVDKYIMEKYEKKPSNQPKNEDLKK